MASKYTEVELLAMAANIDQERRDLATRLNSAQNRVDAIEAELQSKLEHNAKVVTELDDSDAERSTLETSLAELNENVAATHRKRARTAQRAETIAKELAAMAADSSERSPEYRKKRRTRARLLAEDDELREQAAKLTEKASSIRFHHGENQKQRQDLVVRQRRAAQQLADLQNDLPSPALLAHRQGLELAAAACDRALGGSQKAHATTTLAVAKQMVFLHQQLRAGRYHVDTTSTLTGLRSPVTRAAMYAATAAGCDEITMALFDAARDDDLRLDDITEAFQSLCLGLWLKNEHSELQELTGAHRYDFGIHGATARAFDALQKGKNNLAQEAIAELRRLHQREKRTDGLDVGDPISAGLQTLLQSL